MASNVPPPAISPMKMSARSGSSLPPPVISPVKKSARLGKNRSLIKKQIVLGAVLAVAAAEASAAEAATKPWIPIVQDRKDRGQDQKHTQQADR